MRIEDCRADSPIVQQLINVLTFGYRVEISVVGLLDDSEGNHMDAISIRTERRLDDDSRQGGEQMILVHMLDKARQPETVIATHLMELAHG
jgi:hypothetical protein